MSKEQRVTYPDNHVMAIAWRDCMAWVLSDPKQCRQFEAATGVKIGRAPIEAMIDGATGHDHYQHVADAFVEWFNANVWGEDPFAHKELKR